jgi:predicted site-specific integrase-resolvase
MIPIALYKANREMENKWRSMKAVIYARYSSDNQREESIEGQIRECKVPVYKWTPIPPV